MEQTADTTFNQSTGRATVAVSAATSILTIPVIPGTGRRAFELNDEYGYGRFAYYKLDVQQPKGIDVVVTPVTDDGSVGCQAAPEFPLSPLPSMWSDTDNLDNEDGHAFRSYVLEFDAPAKAGLGLTIGLDRWVKYYYAMRNPVGHPGSGKYDRPRPLTIHIVAQTEESFRAYVQRRQWA